MKNHRILKKYQTKKKKKKKSVRTLYHQLNKVNKEERQPQLKIEELDNGVHNEKRIIEIGSGNNRRKIDLGKYILK